MSEEARYRKFYVNLLSIVAVSPDIFNFVAHYKCDTEIKGRCNISFYLQMRVIVDVIVDKLNN
jgi:hypothetical protein